MADTRPTKVGFFRATYLCILAAFSPARLMEAERQDDVVRAGFPKPAPPPTPRAIVLRNALWWSLVAVVSSVVAGTALGFLLKKALVQRPGSIPIVLQVVGAMLLLWGTLFVRGWDIQSYGGVMLTERVNRWLYRSLYCIGTALVVSSLALSW